MFINLSNHPSSDWDKEQILAAETLGGAIVDLTFPDVDPSGDEDYVASLAGKYVQQVLAMGDASELTVHVMGEMTLTYAIITKLLAAGVTCVASTTERIIRQFSDGRKESVFRFVRFRKYG